VAVRDRLGGGDGERRVDQAQRQDDGRGEQGDPAREPWLTSWVQLFGVVSFELFGQFNNVIDARAEYFDQQMELMADLLRFR
jgi:Tetracyclin repressor-like, C-terminal domain